MSASLLALTSTPIAARSLETTDGVRAPFRNQSWQMSGRLVVHDGEAFSYDAIFFRYAEPHGVVLYAATLSVLDESSKRLVSERRTERAGLGLAEATSGRLAVRVGTWRLSQSSPIDAAPSFELTARVDGVGLVVHGIALKPRFELRSAATGHDGYSSIASSGTITIDGRRLEVRGKSWFDREYSDAAPKTDAPVTQVRVQLDDGREIYVETSGSVIAEAARLRAYLFERSGAVDILQRSSYQFGEHPGSTWLSPHTRTNYADIWGLHVDDKTEYLSLEPVTYDRESLSTGDGVSFWQGAVDVYDVTPGSQGLRLGSGSVLMYGYPHVRPNRDL